MATGHEEFKGCVSKPFARHMVLFGLRSSWLRPAILTSCPVNGGSAGLIDNRIGRDRVYGMFAGPTWDPKRSGKGLVP